MIFLVFWLICLPNFQGGEGGESVAIVRVKWKHVSYFQREDIYTQAVTTSANLATAWQILRDKRENTFLHFYRKNKEQTKVRPATKCYFIMQFPSNKNMNDIIMLHFTCPRQFSKRATQQLGRGYMLQISLTVPVFLCNNCCSFIHGPFKRNSALWVWATVIMG